MNLEKIISYVSPVGGTYNFNAMSQLHSFVIFYLIIVLWITLLLFFGVLSTRINTTKGRSVIKSPNPHKTITFSLCLIGVIVLHGFIALLKVLCLFIEPTRSIIVIAIF